MVPLLSCIWKLSASACLQQATRIVEQAEAGTVHTAERQLLCQGSTWHMQRHLYQKLLVCSARVDCMQHFLLVRPSDHEKQLWQTFNRHQMASTVTSVGEVQT